MLLNVWVSTARAEIKGFVKASGNRLFVYEERSRESFQPRVNFPVSITPENQIYKTRRLNKDLTDTKTTFYFSGAGQYYLFYKSQAMVDEVFEDAQALGIDVIRTWGFCDGVYQEGHSFQPLQGVYNEDTFVKMDYTISKAEQCGIRLIIPLVNNWPDFGGMDQYVDWSPTASTHDDFYTNTYCKGYYKDYVSYFLNRVNTITGVKYKDDPTIMVWELANEPRCESDTSGDTLYNWINEMAAYIKGIDENHLVATGEEGFYSDGSGWLYNGSMGVDFLRNSQCEYIDICTFHLYPDIGFFDMTESAALTWIGEHVEDAHSIIGKPIYLGEFGVMVHREKNAGNRDVIHGFDADRENWSFNSYWAGNAYTSNPTWDGTTGYNGDGSIYYDAYFNGTYEQEGIGEVRYYETGAVDFSAYDTISVFVRIESGAPYMQADIFMKDMHQFTWTNGTYTNLWPGQWAEISIDLNNPGFDYSQVAVLGVRVTNKDGGAVYDGPIYYDFVKGQGVINEMDERNRIYQNWYDLLDASDTDGAAFWILSGHDYLDYDHFTVYSPEDTETCAIIESFSSLMADKSGKGFLNFKPLSRTIRTLWRN